MSEDESPEGKQLRGEPVVRRVLMSVMEEVALSGYGGLTLERVAARAGVNRTTIYRRWPTKKELAIATIQHCSEQIHFDWDLGSLRADMTEFLLRASKTLFTPGMLGMHRMMLEAAHDSELQEVATAVREDKVSHAIEVLTRAEQRGEFRPDLDKRLFLDSIFGTLFMRMSQESLDDPKVLAAILDYLMRVATPPKAKSPNLRKPVNKGKVAPKKAVRRR
jgi:AcrR family transcriptional regulator